MKQLNREARAWLKKAGEHDENWWASRGEDEGICLSINLESMIKRAETFYDMDVHGRDVQKMKKLQKENEAILWG